MWRTLGWPWLVYDFRAWRRGRRSTWLVALPWEELLPLPLDTVRRLRAWPKRATSIMAACCTVPAMCTSGPRPELRHYAPHVRVDRHAGVAAPGGGVEAAAGAVGQAAKDGRLQHVRCTPSVAWRRPTERAGTSDARDSS
jgi:hypothetical protein